MNKYFIRLRGNETIVVYSTSKRCAIDKAVMEYGPRVIKSSIFLVTKNIIL